MADFGDLHFNYLNCLAMKIVPIILFFSLIASFTYASTIDDLKTDRDVAAFILKIDTILGARNGANTIGFSIDNTPQIRAEMNCNGRADKWKIMNWERFDFNGDGRNDLFAYGHQADYFVIIIIDNGDGTYKPLHIYNRNFYECTIAKPVHINHVPLLLYNGKTVIGFNEGEHWTTDTLVYKYGDFVEYNKRPSLYHITSIKFETHGGMNPEPDSYPPRTLQISAISDSATFTLFYQQKPKEVHKTRLDKNAVQQITGLLGYLSIKKAPPYYYSGAMDAGQDELTVTFSNGSTKTITDGGDSAWFGFTYLESIFYKMEASLQ